MRLNTSLQFGTSIWTEMVADNFIEPVDQIKDIKPQRPALNPIIGIDPRVGVLNLDSTKKQD
ncbi:hypothetical protein [Flavivirga jejuensis]|uniref:Uncharacterized protein n=1 Tax=Flavivirga jejuensis TaxID=870487 RepID=A0ABT8WM95_9FLAO|nr:hypothetical protein [Flavivirga jejuensis]MDO5974268.1 hypothetical protein [Flavivirga jejuensis]